MVWIICFIVSISILFVYSLYAFYASKNYKSKRLLSSFNALFIGVFIAVYVGLIPQFKAMLVGTAFPVVKLVMFDFIQTIQVFTINVGADLILDNINSSTTSIASAYSTYMTCLFFVAPILTFGFLMSLLKNAFVSISYLVNYWKDTYIFSELNDRSFILAQSIKENHKNALIIFTNVDKEEGDIVNELVEAAKELKALIFEKDINTVNFTHHSQKANMSFFAICDEEENNIIQSLKILSDYNKRDNTNLYVFSSGIESELLISNASKGKIKVRRIDDVRSAIYRLLFEDGHKLFDTASLVDDKKIISVVIVGFGKYGIEMIKALAWYCQMDGYALKINVFDSNKIAKDKFYVSCPELMTDEYDITIHFGINIESKNFVDLLAMIKDISYVFVSLGEDHINISQSANIRMLCERMGCNPVIKTVVHSQDKKEALEGTTNYRGQPYAIETIGDLESSYSEKVIIDNELEKMALERHLKWGSEEEFWQYEYNYRSSMASAIHAKAREHCGIPNNADVIGILEHKRWNAYMRSEGYIFSGSTDKTTRNDLGKMHHDLVDYESLTLEDKLKDQV